MVYYIHLYCMEEINAVDYKYLGVSMMLNYFFKKFNYNRSYFFQTLYINHSIIVVFYSFIYYFLYYIFKIHSIVN
jgi:hypothetical protein